MIKNLLLAFGSVFLVVLVTDLGMKLIPKLFGRKTKKKDKDQSHNKGMESDKE